MSDDDEQETEVPEDFYGYSHYIRQRKAKANAEAAIAEREAEQWMD